MPNQTKAYLSRPRKRNKRAFGQKRAWMVRRALREQRVQEQLEWIEQTDNIEEINRILPSWDSLQSDVNSTKHSHFDAFTRLNETPSTSGLNITYIDEDKTEIPRPTQTNTTKSQRKETFLRILGTEDISPNKKNITPNKKNITPNKTDITPDKKDITLDKKDITLDRKDITPDKKDITPDKKDITPDKKDITSNKDITSDKDITPNKDITNKKPQMAQKRKLIQEDEDLSEPKKISLGTQTKPSPNLRRFANTPLVPTNFTCQIKNCPNAGLKSVCKNHYLISYKKFACNPTTCGVITGTPVAILDTDKENFLNERCRMCAQRLEKNYHNLFDLKENLTWKLSFTLLATVDPDDNLPKNICNECKKNVDKIYLFTHKILHANVVLNEWIKNKEKEQKTKATVKRSEQAEKNTNQIKSEELVVKLEIDEQAINPSFTEIVIKQEISEDTEIDDPIAIDNVEVDKIKEETIEDVDVQMTKAGIPTIRAEIPTIPTEVIIPAKSTVINTAANTVQSIIIPEIRISPIKTITGDPSKIKKFICSICRALFTNLGALTLHAKAHKTTDVYFTYACTVCQERVREANFVQHQLSHLQNKEFCNSKTEQSLAIECYFVSHLNCCEYCGKTYIFGNALLEHKKLKHKLGEGPNFSCCECSLNFERCSIRDSHYKTVHSEEFLERQKVSYRYTCSLCSLSNLKFETFVSHLNQTHFIVLDNLV